MSIFSSVKSAASKAYKAVKSAFSGGGQTATVYNAAPTTKPAGSSGSSFQIPYAASPFAGTRNFVPGSPAPAASIGRAPAPTTVKAGGGGGGGGSSGGKSSSVQSSYNFQVPTTISRNSLSGGANFSAANLPSVPAPTTMAATGGGGFDLSTLLTPGLAEQGFTVDTKTGQLVAPQDSPDEVGKLTKMKETISKLFPAPQKKEDIYANLAKESGLDEKKNTMNALASQLNQIKAQKDANLLQLRDVGAKEGVTEAVYGGQQAQIEREATIKSLPLAAQFATAQADYQAAQEHVDKYFSIISADMQAEYQYKTRIIEKLMDVADKEEERLLSEKNKKDDREFTMKRDMVGQLYDMSSKFMASGQAGLGAQAMTLAQNYNDPDFATKAAKLLGQYVPKSEDGAVKSAGFSDAEIEADVRESVVDALGDVEAGVLPLDKAYSKLRLLYSPNQVTDQALKELLGIKPPTEQTIAPTSPTSQSGSFDFSAKDTLITAVGNMLFPGGGNIINAIKD